MTSCIAPAGTICACAEQVHHPRLVVLTGGPGAGKTAVLEIVRRAFCEHVIVLPEAATVLFSGGFPRHDGDAGLRAAQQAIFHVQRAMEQMAIDEQKAAVVLCDRGTIDGLAYWPSGIDAGCDALRIRRDEELLRYAAVIHLRTPSAGYDRSNPHRTESLERATALDARTESAWSGHASRVFIAGEDDFLEKVANAIAAIRAQVPSCCRQHRVADVDEK